MVAADWLARTRAGIPSLLSKATLWYAAAVVVGSVLIVLAAINQPFSYDEITQISPYGSDNIDTITGATRQPPLDPLLGAMFQHLFGVGQLQQRLVPVLAGIGTLNLVSLLFHRLGLGRAGAFGIWVLATAPLMVRYSAYTRPYALPMFLMIAFGFAAQHWLDQRQLHWLAVAAVAAVALPLARVPEPTVFLGMTAVILAWFAYRGRFSWSQTWPLIVVSLGALIAAGVPMYLSLKSQASAFFDASPSGVIDRFGTGVHEMMTAFLPLLGLWFPWWPITGLAVVAALAFPAPRKLLFHWWIWWPLLAAPVAFALAYHFLNPVSFDVLPYRARAEVFFVPAYVLMMVALASVVTNRQALAPRLRMGLSVLLGLVLLGQLPATARVTFDNAAPDFGQISGVLTQRLPDDAIVLYDRPTPVDQSRQPFLGTPRYMGDTPKVETIADLTGDAAQIPEHGPVYVLFNGQCASTGRCDPTSTSPWDHHVGGWQIIYQHERFTLYESLDGQDGRPGVIAALRAFGEGLGPELGYVETFLAATMLNQEGHSAEGKALIQRMYEQASPDLAQRIRDKARSAHLDPYE
ncbi:MAG: glycosyltransferase family 39 protein [Nocardioidaceae bacterium]